MPQTADFLYSVNAALAGQFVSLVSNKDGVTKFAATVASNLSGQWTINPKPPAGTYTLYSGASQGALTTLVDPDYVVDPFDDLQNTYLPGWLVVGNSVGNQPFTPNQGDIIANRGGASPGAGAIFFGSSNPGVHYLFYDGTRFNIPDALSIISAPAANLLILDTTAGNNHLTFRVGGVSQWVEYLSGGALRFFDVVNAADRVRMWATGGGPGIEVVTGGLIVDAGGLTVTAGGFIVTGASSISATGAQPLSLNRTEAAASMTHLNISRGGVNKWAMGLDSLDQFTLYNAAQTQVNMRMTDAGAFTVRASLDLDAAGQFNIGSVNATLIVMGRGSSKAVVQNKALTTFAAGAQTLTASNLIGGAIEHTVTAAVADTFDTGANLDALFSSNATGDSFDCYLTIIGAFTVTLTAAAGITIKGTTALLGTAAGKTAHLAFRRTGAGAWTCYVVFST